MELIITFVIFLLVILAMAIGVIFNRQQLQGSCGGLATLQIERSCDCETSCEQHRLYQIQEPN
ncbi:(Na+)-NQR maturation NqrM [Psychromonas sp. MME2]|uniref:(Na+)-NQR maturation NqrM n=1 Tax=unclassified Psychromonas TaxID=2614957 RepID=UPI00339CA8FA